MLRYTISWIITFLLLFSAAQASAQPASPTNAAELKKIVDEALDDGDGPMVLLELTNFALPEEDNLFIYRLMAGYTFPIGFQVGGHFTGLSLSKPSVAGLTVQEPCKLVVAKCNEPPQALKEDVMFAAVGPMIGWDLPFIRDWFGLETTVLAAFPFITDTSGWSFEVGTSAYFSFDGLIKIAAEEFRLDLRLMVGPKFAYVDYAVNRYEIKQAQMMPQFGLMGQF